MFEPFVSDSRPKQLFELPLLKEGLMLLCLPGTGHSIEVLMEGGKERGQGETEEAGAG